MQSRLTINIRAVLTRIIGEVPLGLLGLFGARLLSSPIGYRLARGAFWSLAGAMISRVLGLISAVLVARILGKSEYGELGVIQSTVGMFGAFAGFGMGLTATKYVAQLRGKDPERAGRIIGLSNQVAWVCGLVLSGALLLLAPWLAESTLAAPHLRNLLRIGCLLLLFSAVNGAQTGALSGFEAFKRIAKINLVTGVAAFPLMVGGVWIARLPGAVWGLVVAQGINCMLNHLALHKEAVAAGVPLGGRGFVQELGVVWSFSVPALFSNVLVGPVYWVCSTMLVNRPDGYGEMGVFGAANQWFGALMFLPTVLAQAVLPVLSQQFAATGPSKSRKIMVASVKLNGALLLPLILIGCAISPYIMAAYGPGYEKGWRTLSTILVTAGLLGIESPVGQVLAASGRMWVSSAMNLGWAACFVLATYLFLPWGAFGLALARLLAYVVHAFWVAGFAWSLTKTQLQTAVPETIPPL